MSVPTVALNEATPAGGDKIREGDDRIREYKVQNREIMDVDHKYDSSGQDADMGKHNKISFLESADLPAGAEGKPILGAQTMGGKAELVFVDEDNNDVQITSGGALYGAIPAGVIVMWSGAVSVIPTGWVICDGANSTPDLTDRFVIHADADSAGTRNVGDTGGSHTKDLSHNHTGNTGYYQAGASSGADGDVLTGNHRHTISTDGSATQDIMPKYYALAYIMKT